MKATGMCQTQNLQEEFSPVATSEEPRKKFRRFIYRAWIRRRDGRKDWAKDHGRKAWKIPVDENGKIVNA